VSEPTREQLRAENWAQAAQIEALQVTNAVLAGQVQRLTRTVAELTARLEKNSKNSSMPPSSDSPKARAEATKSRADRRAEDKERRKDELERKRGKQPGAPGQNLSMRLVPDEIVEHEPATCTSCGDDLATGEVVGIERRQVFDVPRPVLICTEHRSLSKRCACGTLNKATFPTEASAPAAYGPGIRAAALYLLHGQHLSVGRTKEALSALLGAEVSTGFVASLATEAAKGLAGFLAEIRQRLISASVIHADETTDQVRTDTWWFHVASNERYTYLFASPTRGKSAPDEAGVLGDFSGVMVHDRFPLYFNYEGAAHAICGAHLLRDLAAVGAEPTQGWAIDMAALLIEMNTAAHQARQGAKSALGTEVLGAYLGRYDALALAGLAANANRPDRKSYKVERDAYNLAIALTKLRTEATRFATDLAVPFTNNEAERSLRMAKLHKKISGCFQSDDGARAFATVRSYLATARKHNVGALDVLTQLFSGQAWMPPRTT
jgi:transposase